MRLDNHAWVEGDTSEWGFYHVKPSMLLERACTWAQTWSASAKPHIRGIAAPVRRPQEEQVKAWADLKRCASALSDFSGYSSRLQHLGWQGQQRMCLSQARNIPPGSQRAPPSNSTQKVAYLGEHLNTSQAVRPVDR